MGSYFWIHWVTQIPGGILARKYGTKMVFGLANLIGCLICFLMPVVSFIDYRLLIVLRVIQGIICGVVWPSMHNMVAQWIPPDERGTFVTAYMGSSVGVAVFFPVFGYLISWTSWEWVFHLTGVTGIIWFFAWNYLAFDTPAKHPRIDPEERAYIEKSLGTVDQNHSKVNRIFI